MRLDLVALLYAALAAVCGCSAPAVSASAGDGSWSLEQTTSDGAVLGVWGSGPNDVWAVGGQSDRSLVMHGDGSSWTPVAVSGTSVLFSVYGFSSSDVYAVGEGGLILHYDGITWTRIESGTTLPLFGLWGASGDDVWIVGGAVGTAGAAVVLRGARGSFATVDLPAGLAPNVLFKTHGFAADDVMMVGSEGTVLRWNGTAWSRDVVPTTEPLFSTWARGVADVYAVGGSDLGEIVHYDGAQWSEVAELPIGGGLSGVFTLPDEPTVTVGLPFVFEIDPDGALDLSRATCTGSDVRVAWSLGRRQRHDIRRRRRSTHVSERRDPEPPLIGYWNAPLRGGPL